MLKKEIFNDIDYKLNNFKNIKYLNTLSDFTDKKSKSNIINSFFSRIKNPEEVFNEFINILNFTGHEYLDDIEEALYILSERYKKGINVGDGIDYTSIGDEDLEYIATEEVSDFTFIQTTDGMLIGVIEEILEYYEALHIKEILLSPDFGNYLEVEYYDVLKAFKKIVFEILKELKQDIKDFDYDLFIDSNFFVIRKAIFETDLYYSKLYETLRNKLRNPRATSWLSIDDLVYISYGMEDILFNMLSEISGDPYSKYWVTQSELSDVF